MGLFKSKKGSLISETFKPLQDLGPIKATTDLVEVSLYGEHLELKANLKKHEPITLQYSQITDAEYGMESEIVEKSRSVIGRAIAGGLLFGGVGAVVSGISGTGTKQKEKPHFYLIISYTSKDGQDAFLQFEDTRLFKGPKLAKQLRELCGLKEDQPENITAL